MIRKRKPVRSASRNPSDDDGYEAKLAGAFDAMSRAFRGMVKSVVEEVAQQVEDGEDGHDALHTAVDNHLTYYREQFAVVAGASWKAIDEGLEALPVNVKGGLVDGENVQDVIAGIAYATLYEAAAEKLSSDGVL